jgi:hypothetical protein
MRRPTRGGLALAAAVLRGAVGAEAARALAGDLRAACREAAALLGGLARPKTRPRGWHLPTLTASACAASRLPSDP